MESSYCLHRFSTNHEIRWNQAFVMNAFKAGMVPPGVKVKTDQEHVRRLQQEGYQVEVSNAYDEQGHHRPAMSAIWRKKL